MNHWIEITKLFFRLGLVAFGGPAAHIAMIHKEVVEKRKWMDEEHFLDLVGATSLIPGPNSTEMVIHCGFHRGGLVGLLVAGISFIVPACLLTGIFAYFYTLAFKIPDFDSYLIGIKAVVIILIFQALQKLWKKAIKNIELGFVAALVFILGLLGVGEVLALLLGSLIGFTLVKVKSGYKTYGVDLLSLFFVFSKIGAVLFGSGYVLIAYLQDELVENRGWITSSQLSDAIAIGQLTPGPVLSTSTFIGYIISGGGGAVVASVGIFLPSFIFVYILNPYIPKMRGSKNFSILLNNVNAGVIGLMAYALIPLSKLALFNAVGIVVFVLLSLVVWRFSKLGSVSLVALGALLGGVPVALLRFFA